MEIFSIQRACDGCLTCQLLDPEIRVALTMPTPMSSLHKSPRFGDRELGVTLDGINIAEIASDIMIGAVGWAWCYHVSNLSPKPGKFHVCPWCKAQPCMYIAHGRVEIPRAERPIPSILDDSSSITPEALRALFNG